MEVTSVSPSATSPTEGDDLCEIDVTSVAIHSMTLLISLCGLVGNGAVLCLLRLKAHNIRIFDLAFADFLFLLFTVPSTLLFLVEDVSCSPIMPLVYLGFLFQLSVISYYLVLFRMLWISAVNYSWNLSKLCCRWKPPERLRWLVRSVQYWAVFTLFTVIPTVTSLCLSHHQEQCRAAVISVYTVILLLFVVPTVTFHAIDLIKAERGSKKQQRERREIIISLVMLLAFLLSLCNFLQQLGYILMSSQVVFLLNCTQSSIKPFIYFFVGRCWRLCSVGSLRLSLQRVFAEPEENPWSMKSLRLSLRSMLNLLKKPLRSMRSLWLSLRRMSNLLKKPLRSMRSHQLSLRSMLNLLKENLRSMRSHQLSLQRVFDGLEEKIAHSNHAPKDMGV